MPHLSLHILEINSTMSLTYNKYSLRELILNMASWGWPIESSTRAFSPLGDPNPAFWGGGRERMCNHPRLMKDAFSLKMALCTPVSTRSPVAEPAKHNMKCDRIASPNPPKLSFVSESFLLARLPASGDRPIYNPSSVQKSLVLILFGAVSVKCDEIQNRQDTHAL